MKKLIIFLFCLPLIVSSQANLVPNPSFEDTISCPIYGGQLTYAIGWINPPISYSADFLHACSSNPYIDVPINNWGIQNARTGDGYAGILTYSLAVGDPTNPYNNAREYILTKLNDTLRPNRCYTISFYYSIAEVWSNLSVTNLGVLLLDDTLTFNTINNLTDYYTDTTYNYDYWYKFSYDYLAAGGEEFLVIGNFNDNNNSDTIYDPNNPGYMHPPTLIVSYIYIDDVSVIECEGQVGLNEKDKYLKPKLLKIVDVLGRKIQPKKNTTLLYIYDDGSVEKKVLLD